jgi:hypothetical protein
MGNSRGKTRALQPFAEANEPKGEGEQKKREADVNEVHGEKASRARNVGRES